MKFKEWSELVFTSNESNAKKDAKLGWESCKREIILILNKDLHNCDLSTDSCDQRYIEKIKDL